MVDIDSRDCGLPDRLRLYTSVFGSVLLLTFLLPCMTNVSHRLALSVNVLVSEWTPLIKTEIGSCVTKHSVMMN